MKIKYMEIKMTGYEPIIKVKSMPIEKINEFISDYIHYDYEEEPNILFIGSQTHICNHENFSDYRCKFIPNYGFCNKRKFATLLDNEIILILYRDNNLNIQSIPDSAIRYYKRIYKQKYQEYTTFFSN